MPEVRFRVRWPDQRESLCYSPSSTIKDALKLQHPYRVDAFVGSATEALRQAASRAAASTAWAAARRWPRSTAFAVRRSPL